MRCDKGEYDIHSLQVPFRTPTPGQVLGRATPTVVPLVTDPYSWFMLLPGRPCPMSVSSSGWGHKFYDTNYAPFIIMANY